MGSRGVGGSRWIFLLHNKNTIFNLQGWCILKGSPVMPVSVAIAHSIAHSIGEPLTKVQSLFFKTFRKFVSGIQCAVYRVIF